MIVIDSKLPIGNVGVLGESGGEQDTACEAAVLKKVVERLKFSM